MSMIAAACRSIMITVSGTSYTIEEHTQALEPFPLDSQLTTGVMILKWLLWCVYLGLRLSSLPGLNCHNCPAPWSAWLMFLAEVFALLPPFLSQLDLSLYIVYGDRSWRRARLCLAGDAAPTIDVFVTCCGEDVDLVMNTVEAAASQDYPSDRYRVFVLDDAGSTLLERAVAAYRSDLVTKIAKPEIIYLSRQRSQETPKYFKAGNLQFGLSESANSGFQSEFIAALDADAIAERDWLRRSVPHLLLDGKLALVNSTQPRMMYSNRVRPHPTAGLMQYAITSAQVAATAQDM
ncbi:hypothetical protein DL767_003068 [Monosporascus sp. MG133]|nr:hypothetical protein DL767_003068 [Monosporascus sp. MG133]